MKIRDCLIISRKKRGIDEPMLEIGKNENAVIERNISISKPLTFCQRLKYLLFNDPLWKIRKAPAVIMSNFRLALPIGGKK